MKDIPQEIAEISDRIIKMADEKNLSIKDMNWVLGKIETHIYERASIKLSNKNGLCDTTTKKS